MNWKYTDESRLAAFRITESGGMESCLVSRLPEGTPIEDPTAPVLTVADYENAIQVYLDEIARSWGYDSILSAATYASCSIIPRFKAEGTVLANFRDLVWDSGYQLLAAHAADAQPPAIADIIAALPNAPTRPA